MKGDPAFAKFLLGIVVGGGVVVAAINSLAPTPPAPIPSGASPPVGQAPTTARIVGPSPAVPSVPAGKPAASRDLDCGESEFVREAAREAVRARLKAPSTARFDVAPLRVVPLPASGVKPCSYLVMGMVAAMNPFGVPLRDGFRVTIQRPSVQGGVQFIPTDLVMPWP